MYIYIYIYIYDWGGSGMGLTQSLSLSSSASAMGAMGVSVAQLTNKLTKNSGWEGIKKRLRLLVEEDEHSTEPLAETYSGYVPVSVRIAELALFEHASAPWLSNEVLMLSLSPSLPFSLSLSLSLSLLTEYRNVLQRVCEMG